MKKRIMVDMDDVMCRGGFMGIINEFLGTDYNEDDVPNYYMQDLVPEKLKEDFFDYFMARNFYDYCELEPYVVETLEELNEMFEIFIGTSYIIKERVKESGVIMLYKYNYLQENFPFLDQRNFVFVGNKIILDCYAKIDDRIENLKRARRKILYSSYHNESIGNDFLEKEGVERAIGWPDVKVKLLRKK